MMASAAVLDGSDMLDKVALQAMLVARICVDDGATRTELTKENFPLVSPLLSQATWRITLELDIAVLKADGLLNEKAGRLRATQAAGQLVLAYLGGKARLPSDWAGIRNGRLIAKALGLDKASKERLSGLQKSEGLRCEILLLAYGLKIKPPMTLAKIRSALAIIALERAFGNQITSGLGSGSGLSAKASRLLAGQLAHKRRDYGTDRRLIDVLAAQYLEVSAGDILALQAALLRSLLRRGAGFVRGEACVTSIQHGSQKKVQAVKPSRHLDEIAAASDLVDDAANQNSAPPLAGAMPGPHAGASQADEADQNTLAPVKPDLVGFSKAVLQQAQQLAKGWSGDRKAFISHVSESIRQSYPQWALSDIEFKCMLTEAQQAGSIHLAYADLKDKRNIADVLASAITYKNTVWHYIRVEA